MERLEIAATTDTPKVILDKVEGKFEISERSLPENALGFYSPITQWIETYFLDPNKNTPFTFRFEYCNTSSSKQVFKILSLLKGNSEKSTISILWLYKVGDEDIMSLGERCSKLLNMNFDIKEY